jgi:hypothetical protein
LNYKKEVRFTSGCAQGNEDNKDEKVDRINGIDWIRKKAKKNKFTTNQTLEFTRGALTTNDKS